MKNEYEVRGEVTAIFLNRKDGMVLETLIDTDDLVKVNGIDCTWFVVRDTKTKFYVYAKYENKSIKLHRYLMDYPNGMQVDHINGNSLDNRRAVNLRVATNSQNQQNRTDIHSKYGKELRSEVRGVHWNKKDKRWVARITIENKSFHLGSFIDVREAERVMKEARKKRLPYSQEALS